MTKPLASLLLSACLCVPTWAGRDVVATVDSETVEQEIRNALRERDVTVDRDAIEQEIRKTIREIETQLPELLKAIRIHVQVPEVEVHIPEIHVPQIRIPEIHVQVPTDVQIPAMRLPEINIPEIHIQIPRIDIRDLPK